MCSQGTDEFIERQIFDLASDIPVLNEQARQWFLSQGPDIVDILMNALEDRRLGSVGHWRILLLLRSSPQARILPAVLKVLGNDDTITRPAAMEVLAAIKTPPAVDALIELLGHANTDVVKYASVLLGHTGDKRSISPLVSLLNSPDPSIRYGAISGLIGLKRSEIRSILVEHLKKEINLENQRLIETAL